MRPTFSAKASKCLVVGGLLLVMSLAFAGLVQAANLTNAEKYWLTYMREEEKLARDVYIVLYDKWRLAIFNNISQSEQTHMDAIKTLLDRYGLPDPAKAEVGAFTDPGLQAIYDTLIAQGSLSEVEALQVGVTIEETDIDDLGVAIDAATRKDLKSVYNNLLQGSLNHLKAFVSNLAKYGVTYEP